MFSHRCHGENGEGPGPSEGTFFDFFSNAVRAPNPVPGMASPGRGGRGGGGEVGPRIGDELGGSPRSLRSVIVFTRPISATSEVCASSARTIWGSYGIRIPWSSQGRVQVNVPDRSILRIAFGDRLRTPFELRACSKPDRLGLRPRSSELRSLPLELRSSSMMCARRSPAEQDPAAYRKKIPGLASTIHLDGKFPCI